MIVLTKVDICVDPTSYITAAQATSKDVLTLGVNATDAAGVPRSLDPWLEEGQTVAFVGSSGVGKSTAKDGRLEVRRLESYLKLAREARRADIPRWQLHQENRRGGRRARAAQKHRRKDKGRE